jgi:hypothetical protein
MLIDLGSIDKQSMNAGATIHVAPAVFVSGFARSRYDGAVIPVKHEGRFFVFLNMS